MGGAVVTPLASGVRQHPALPQSGEATHRTRPHRQVGRPAKPIAPARQSEGTQSVVRTSPTTSPPPTTFPRSPRRAETWRSPTHASAAQPTGSYVVTGAVKVSGPVAVRPVARRFGPSGQVSSTTQLVAATSDGQFVLNQKVVDDPLTRSAKVTLEPVMTTGDQAIAMSVQSSSVVTRASDGTLTINVTAVPQAQDAPETWQSLHAHFVLSGDYLHVLSETVTVHGAPSAGGLGTTTITRPLPTITNGGALPAAPDDPAVIGMSTEGMDDQVNAASSTTNGGSFPLLPSPSAGP